jgi:DNA-binding NarL/FixJ family response regulator
MIRDVFEGGTATHSASSSAIVLEAAQATSAHQTPLTARESDIRQLHEAGKSRKEIASELGLKEPTVNAHLHSVFVKEGIGRRRPTR